MPWSATCALKRDANDNCAVATTTDRPAWPARDDDGQPRADGPHDRYLATHWLPHDRELASFEIRRTLRAAAHKAFGHVPDHV